MWHAELGKSGPFYWVQGNEQLGISGIDAKPCPNPPRLAKRLLTEHPVMTFQGARGLESYNLSLAFHPALQRAIVCEMTTQVLEPGRGGGLVLGRQAALRPAAPSRAVEVCGRDLGPLPGVTQKPEQMHHLALCLGGDALVRFYLNGEQVREPVEFDPANCAYDAGLVRVGTEEPQRNSYGINRIGWVRIHPGRDHRQPRFPVPFEL